MDSEISSTSVHSACSRTQIFVSPLRLHINAVAEAPAVHQLGINSKPKTGVKARVWKTVAPHACVNERM